MVIIIIIKKFNPTNSLVIMQALAFIIKTMKEQRAIIYNKFANFVRYSSNKNRLSEEFPMTVDKRI